MMHIHSVFHLNKQQDNKEEQALNLRIWKTFALNDRIDFIEIKN